MLCPLAVYVVSGSIVASVGVNPSEWMIWEHKMPPFSIVSAPCCTNTKKHKETHIVDEVKCRVAY